jgi:hypothetical protein
MAVIELDPEIPNNIVVLPLTKPQLIRRHYERGDLVILSDVRVQADFDFIAASGPSGGFDVRKLKFVFRKSVAGLPENRTAIWERFFGDRLQAEPAACRDIQDAVTGVDAQVDALIRRIFGSQTFSTDFIAWKFQDVTGENLHIDNLSNLNDTAQVRLFVNTDNKPRQWSAGRHWRHYVERHLASHDLLAWTSDATAFNGKLNHAAFGPAWSTCDEPRHLVEFDPGEVWLVNSALTAHQVRGGRRLCSAHYEYPYRDCIEQRETLPHLIRQLGRAGKAERGGAASSLRAMLARLTHREKV